MMKVCRNLFLFLGAVLVLSCTHTPRGPEARALPVTLFYQSGRQGVYEPCGCETTPYGGIDREANAVGEVRREARPVLYVDAGNSLVPLQWKSDKAYYQMKADGMLRMLQSAKLDVFAPGPAEWKLGKEALVELQSKYEVPFVASNVEVETGKSPFHRIWIQTINGVRFAFVSATPVQQVPGVKFLDPQVALPSLIAEAKSNSDVVILLSQMSLEDVEKLVAKTENVQIVVGADTTASLENPHWSNRGKTLLLDPGNFGYVLGRLDLELHLPFQGSFSREEIAQYQKDVAFWEEKLKKDPKDAEATAYVSYIRDFFPVAEIPNGTPYEHQLVRLTEKRFGTQNAVTQIIGEEKERVRQAMLKK